MLFDSASKGKYLNSGIFVVLVAIVVFLRVWLPGGCFSVPGDLTGTGLIMFSEGLHGEEVTSFWISTDWERIFPEFSS
jgi:hypothetical protein